MAQNLTNFSSSYNETEILQIFLLIPVLLIGTVGNLIAVFVFGWQKRNTRKRFETLLLLLAICDFLASLVSPPTFIYAIATHFNQWDFGYVGCKLFLSIGPANVTISHGILVLISYERYRSIANPFGVSIKRPFFILWLVTTLIISLLIVAPYTYSLEIVSDDVYGTNTCNPTKTRHEATIIFALGNVLRDVIASISIITFGIFTTKRMKVGRLIISQIIVQKREKNTAKATKMLIVVATLFSICVIPLDLFQVIQYCFFHRESTTEHYSFVVTCNTFLHILQMTNSATNIIVYSRMHKDFTKSVLDCGRKGNEIIRESISRVTFRSIRTSTNGTHRSTTLDTDDNRNELDFYEGIAADLLQGSPNSLGTSPRSPIEKLLLGTPTERGLKQTSANGSLLKRL